MLSRCCPGVVHTGRRLRRMFHGPCRSCQCIFTWMQRWILHTKPYRRGVWVYPMLLNYPLNDLNLLLWNITHQMQTFLGPEDRLADNDSFRNNGITQLSARRSFWAITSHSFTACTFLVHIAKWSSVLILFSCTCACSCYVTLFHNTLNNFHVGWRQILTHPWLVFTTFVFLVITILAQVCKLPLKQL